MFKQNAFELFNIKPSLEFDKEKLESKYYDFMKQFDPNRYDSIVEKKVANQMACFVNESYHTLCDSFKIIKLLVELSGISTECEICYDTELLEEIMFLKENRDQVKSVYEQTQKIFEQAFIKQDKTSLKKLFVKLCYLRKLL